MIKTAVGKGRLNKPADVVVIQLLLNHALSNSTDSEEFSKLSVDGVCSTNLIKAIEQYQSYKKLKYVDGWVGTKGKTIKTLIADAKAVNFTSRANYIRSKFQARTAKPVLHCLLIANFISLYEKQYKALSSGNRAGLKTIVTTAIKDKNLQSIAEFAYMLATTKHETANTFRPIEEYGKGAGKSYGKEVAVINPSTKKEVQNKYYGRGYVQLTWGYNYQRLDHYLGNGSYPNRFKTKSSDYNRGYTINCPMNSVYLNPKKVLDEDIAYKCMMWGMQGGHFTGVANSRYIKTNSVDYYNARKVINGLDKASLIAGYAEDFEVLLLIASQ